MGGTGKLDNSLRRLALRTTLKHAIANGAARSWEAGVRAARRDLRWISRFSGLAVEPVEATQALGLLEHADAVAGRYVTAIRQAEIDAQVERSKDIIRTAIEDEKWRLDRIAVTENSVAFNDARIETVDLSVQQADLEAKTGLKLVAYWDALLDACENCNSLDGKDEPHWGGERPGAVHVNCRCSYHFELR